jgi:hypothetical protein
MAAASMNLAHLGPVAGAAGATQMRRKVPLGASYKRVTTRNVKRGMRVKVRPIQRRRCCDYQISRYANIGIVSASFEPRT